MITYEWVIETVDEYGDIQNVNHADTFIRALEITTAIRAEGKSIELGLTRNRWSDFDGNLEDRQWAYLETDGTLPTHFDDGAKIPTRFHTEIQKTKSLSVSPTRHSL